MGNKDENLITRAAKLLKEYTGYKKGAVISLAKRIPLGAGLGGGSADAAAVLIGLNRLWKTGLTKDQLIKVGSRIGCDVPALIHGGTIHMEGRGEIITPIKSTLKDFWILLVYPGFAISTADIYQRLDQRQNRTNCSSHRKFRLILSGLEKASLNDVGKGLFNAFQETVWGKFPVLEMIKNNLERLGAKHVLLTGSGSTVFVLLKEKKEGQRMARLLGKQIGLPLWIRVVHTIGRTECEMTI